MLNKMKSRSLSGKKYIALLIPLIVSMSFAGTLQASDRSVVKIGGDVHIEKDMRVDDAVAVGGSVYVDGIVDGDAVAVGGTIHLGEEAIVHGDAVTVGGKLDKAEGAMIYGTTVDVGSFDFENLFKDMNFFDGHRSIPRGLKFIPVIGLIALALLFVVLIPKELNTVTSNIKNEPIIMFLYGLLGVVLIVPLTVMLAISIIGIALIPIEILAIFLALLIGYIAVAILIGKKILIALNNEDPSVIFSALLGIVLLWLIGLIPFVGFLVKLIAWIVGFGAVIIAVARRNRKKEIVIEPEPVKAIETK